MMTLSEKYLNILYSMTWILVFVISIDDYHQSDFAQIVVQCSTTELVLIHLMVFFVVIDVKFNVVDLLLLKPVHAVLQDSIIQINVYIPLWWYKVVYSLIV